MRPFNWAGDAAARRGRTSRARNGKKSRDRKQRTIESLEVRLALAADVESYDGTGNNLLHPTWGSDNTQLLRIAPAQYGDGISSPGGAGLPSAREVSNVVASHPDDEVLNNRDLTAMMYAFGQFLDHGIDYTPDATPAESFNVAVPAGDPFFDPQGTGTQEIPLNRSVYDPTTGTSVDNVRQQINTISAFIDGSQIYGSTPERAAALRTFEGGHLKTSDGNMLPFNTDGLPNSNDAHLVPDDQLFLAGDVRANDNIELLAIQTLFMREHNRIADRISAEHPGMSDEEIYQQARKMTVAEVQAIAFNEFLPALLGPNAIQPYTGYHPDVSTAIANEFSTAAFRFGHSMLGSDVEFLDDQGNEVHDAVDLRNVFFNPGVMEETGIDPILKYLASDRAEEIDTKVVDDLRNFLFGQPGQGGFDLASLNIQRGRDHGLADYNSVREAYGLPRVHSFADITSDPTLQQELQQLYGSVDNIDLWVGGLAEDHVPGSSVGPLFSRIIADQFTRLRDGDRFWYQNEFSPAEAQRISHVTLEDIIQLNTGLSNLQDNVFFLHTSISGQVFSDGNADGRHQPVEQGLANVTVNLLDAEGNVVATTQTDARGLYHFNELDLGTYQVVIDVPDGGEQTTPPPQTIAITRGMEVGHIDFGVSGLSTRPHHRHGPPPRPMPPAMHPVHNPVAPPVMQPVQAGGMMRPRR
ncbi:MAG TPA: peroxidase family protein [Pirellulales bacterium]|nr:peroxidase family protein [Pirellulales bacterium]